MPRCVKPGCRALANGGTDTCSTHKATRRPCQRQGCKSPSMRNGNFCSVHDPAKAMCAKAGCRAKAMNSSIFCTNHDPITRQKMGASRGNIGYWINNLTSLFTDEEQDTLTTRFGPALDMEIAALRVLLLRSFSEDNRERVIATVNALVKAATAQHRLKGDQANDLVSAIDRVLAELGVGEGES